MKGMWNNRIFEISSGLYHFFKWKDKALFTVIRKKIIPNTLEPLDSSISEDNSPVSDLAIVVNTEILNPNS